MLIFRTSSLQISLYFYEITIFVIIFCFHKIKLIENVLAFIEYQSLIYLVKLLIEFSNHLVRFTK